MNYHLDDRSSEMLFAVPFNDLVSSYMPEQNDSSSNYKIQKESGTELLLRKKLFGLQLKISEMNKNKM